MDADALILNSLYLYAVKLAHETNIVIQYTVAAPK